MRKKLEEWVRTGARGVSTLRFAHNLEGPASDLAISNVSESEMTTAIRSEAMLVPVERDIAFIAAAKETPPRDAEVR